MLGQGSVNFAFFLVFSLIHKNFAVKETAQILSM